MKWFYYLFIFLFALVFSATVFALTPEEILLLKRAGVSDEKILEIQKKEGGASPKPTAIPPINAFDWNEDGKIDLLVSNKKIVEQIGGRTDETPFGIFLLMNTGTKEKPEFKELKPVKGKFKDDVVL